MRTKTPSLCMQYSLLSQESPPSIKTLRLEIGLCHEKNGAPRFCLTYLEDWQRILAGQQKMPDRSSSCGFKGKECTSFSICKTTFLLDSWPRSSCVYQIEWYKKEKRTRCNIFFFLDQFSIWPGNCMVLVWYSSFNWNVGVPSYRMDLNWALNLC